MSYNVTIYNGTMDNVIYSRQFGDIDGILDLEIIPVKGIKGIPEQIKEVNQINNNTTKNEKGEGNITTFAKKEVDKTTTVPSTTNNTANINERIVDSENERNSNSIAILSNTSSIPLSKSTIKTTTYGPDLSAPITGTYHIEGAILVEPNDYIIKVELTSIDGKSPSKPIEDVFLLPAKLL